MKSNYRLLSMVTVLLIVAVAFFVWPKEQRYTISYAEAADLQQSATPQSLYKTFENNVSNTLNTSTQLDYAIPNDIDLYTSQPSGSGNNLSYAKTAIFQDLNGDGLPDVIFASNYPQLSYVLINNGQGFDIAYYCSSSGNPAEYRGHCAQ